MWVPAAVAPPHAHRLGLDLVDGHAELVVVGQRGKTHTSALFSRLLRDMGVALVESTVPKTADRKS